MSLIDAEGTYRGKIVDGGLSESTNNFPQEVLSLAAEEVYDSDAEEWLPVDQEHSEITYYGVLFDSKNKKTLNCKQLQKITGWDGASFVALSKINLADVPIQFRVEPNTYKENTTLQVSWIDVYDAIPGRTVQKLDKDGVTALQAKYASILATTKGPVKAVSAKDKPASKQTATETASAQKSPARPQVTKPRPKPAVSGGKCTADEAWDACASLKRDDVTEEQLSEIWVAKVDEVTKGKPENKITTSDWFKIKELVQKETSKV